MTRPEKIAIVGIGILGFLCVIVIAAAQMILTLQYDHIELQKCTSVLEERVAVLESRAAEHQAILMFLKHSHVSVDVILKEGQPIGVMLYEKDNDAVD